MEVLKKQVSAARSKGPQDPQKRSKWSVFRPFLRVFSEKVRKDLIIQFKLTKPAKRGQKGGQKGVKKGSKGSK